MYSAPEHSVRLDVRIPADLRTAAKMAAAARGVSLSAAVRESLHAYIAATASNDQRPDEGRGAGGDSQHPANAIQEEARA